jgi:hypothetical protein
MMKRISFYKFLLVVLITAGTYSCKNIMDFHQDYIKNGEIVYLTKMDSVVSYPGKNRIQLSGYLNNAYNVNAVVVYWNNRADSMIFDYLKIKDMDSLNLIIPNLPEKSYIFDMYTINNIGNRSIKVSISATSYGEFYRKNLTPRTNKGFSFDGKLLKALWLTADNLEKGTQIRYTTESSGIQNLFLSPDSSSIALPDRKSDTPFSFNSIYIPEKGAIDTFQTAWTTIPVTYDAKVSKDGWSIAGFSTQEPAEGAPNGLATAVIDDKLNTFWHSQWSGGNPPYPHWFTIDMGKDVIIACIEVFRRQGNGGGQTKHQFFYSSNGTDWTDFGTFPMDATTNAGQKFRMATSPTARYIKYVALQGPNFYAFLAELNVYSPKN